MGLTIKCPQCQTLIDATEAAPGSTVVCPDCSATMRVPSGHTGEHAKTGKIVKSGGGGRSTPLFRRMAGARTAPAPGATRPSMFSAGPRGAGGRKTGNPGMIAALAVGGVAVIAGLVYLNSSTQAVPLPKKAVEPAIVISSPEAPAPPPVELPSPSPIPASPSPEESMPPLPPRDVSRVNFRQIADALRGGRMYDDRSRPEGDAMWVLKSVAKKAAVEGLLPFFDDEDPAFAVGINAALNFLTGETFPKPAPSGREAAKKKWVDWAAAQP